MREVLRSPPSVGILYLPPRYAAACWIDVTITEGPYNRKRIVWQKSDAGDSPFPGRRMYRHLRRSLMRNIAHRALRSFGIHIERHRDPYRDLATLVGSLRCAVDGGAYHGGVSRTLLSLFPDLQVHAFEPQRELCSRLEAEARGNPRWHVYPLALSDSAGEAAFHVPSAAFTASLLTPSSSFGATNDLTVQTTTLADWATRESLAPDFLKLDLQGAELSCPPWGRADHGRSSGCRRGSQLRAAL